LTVAGGVARSAHREHTWVPKQLVSHLYRQVCDWSPHRIVWEHNYLDFCEPTARQQVKFCGLQ
jgi:hypothetical protein